MFSSKSIIPFISRSISPSLYSFTMLQVIFPFSFILGTIHMLINSEAISFIVCPKTIINISIYMYESSFSMSSVFSPLPNIFCTIWPSLFSKAISEPTFPLSLVDSSCFKFVSWSLLSLLVRVI